MLTYRDADGLEVENDLILHIGELSGNSESVADVGNGLSTTDLSCPKFVPHGAIVEVEFCRS